MPRQQLIKFNLPSLTRKHTYRNVVCTLVASGTLSFPASRRHAAIEIPSSIAEVAPYVEFGMKACAASPTLTIRPFGEVHSGSGSLHMILKSTTVFGGVFAITAATFLSQSRPVFSKHFRASDALSLVDQVSCAWPLS